MDKQEIQDIFTSNFRELRKRNFRSQQEFADKMGTGRSNVGAWEEGRCLPRLEELWKITQIFKISLDKLVYKELPYQK